MAKTVVLTAHGRVIKDHQMKLSHNIVTCCKFGETHQGKHLDFRDLSIFSNSYHLYDYCLTNTDDYTNQGQVLL